MIVINIVATDYSEIICIIKDGTYCIIYTSCLFVYQGLPNFSLPLRDIAGELRKGVPLAIVLMPPGIT